MKKEISEYKVVINEQMKGGPGKVQVVNFASKDELLNHARLFGKLVFEPGCGIGKHQHIDESELFYVNKGELLYTDDDKQYVIKEGELVICEKGHFHGVENVSNNLAELIALIILN